MTVRSFPQGVLQVIVGALELGAFALVASIVTTASVADTQTNVGVAPSKRQLAWQEREFEALVHYGMNTFTGREWGGGTEEPAIFAPGSLDGAQWAQAAKSFGAKALILVCKHHDGFCLWPTAQTDYSVKHARWRDGKGDLVKEVSDACRREGLKFGIYLSPSDLHESSFGRDSGRYNDFFVAQLRELLTGYGEICEVFFDGANPSRRQQKYDWQRYYRTIRELQPNAVIAIRGPDVRWVGNEAGVGRLSEWSTIGLPKESAQYDWHDMMAEDLGSRAQLAAAKEVCWYPAVADVSLRDGWFWRSSTDRSVKSVAKLLEIYEHSVGRNCGLQLNIMPDTSGRIPEADMKRLAEFGEALRSRFGTNVLAGVAGAKSADGRGLTMDLNPPRDLRYVVLREDITRGQRVEAVEVTLTDEEGRVATLKATTVGWKRILRANATKVKSLEVRVLESRDTPILSVEGY